MAMVTNHRDWLTQDGHPLDQLKHHRWGDAMPDACFWNNLEFARKWLRGELEGHDVVVFVQQNPADFLRTVLKTWTPEERKHLNSSTFNGNTALHAACEQKDPQKVLLLLELGVNYKCLNNMGATAMHLAASLGLWVVLVVFLDNGIPLDVLNKHRKTPVHVAHQSIKKQIDAYQKKKAENATAVITTTHNNTQSTSTQKKKRRCKKKKAKVQESSPLNSQAEQLHSIQEKEIVPDVPFEISNKEIVQKLNIFSNDILLFNQTEQPESPPVEVQEVTKDSADHVESQELINTIASAPWQILWTSDAIRSMKKLQSPMKLKVMQRLAFLSEGYRYKKTAKRLTPKALRLNESYLLHGYRLLWQESISYSSKSNEYRDFIKVWDIVAHDDVESFVKRILKKKQQTVLNVEKKSLFDLELVGSDLLPSVVEEEVEEEVDEEELDAIEMIHENIRTKVPRSFITAKSQKLSQEHLRGKNYIDSHCNSYVLDKFYEASSEILHSILDDENGVELELPLHVTPEELNIVKSEGNVLLLGRSGTGKTTCGMLKMWGLYRANKKLTKNEEPLLFSPQSARMHHFHPMFLTVSPVLCAHVQQYLKGLQAAYGLPLFNPKDIPISFRDVPEKCFPLVITFDKLLKMIDQSTPRPFFTDSVIPDMEFQNVSLELHHMMEHEAELRQRKKDHKTINKNLSPLNYHRFAREVWPEMTRSDEWKSFRAFNPSLIWTEISSYIKGSYESLFTKEGYLSQAQYISIGEKKAPNFSGSRKKIYELFILYEQTKKRLHMYDQLDVIQHICRQIMEHGYKGTPLDLITVDEVQDCPEILLQLLLLIGTPSTNFFFCGDTAQTIERGISFRFADVRSLFHHNKDRYKSVPVPVSLTKSFRSTAEILSLGNSVLDIIKHYFPNSIDELPKEEGLCTGPLPVIFPSESKQSIIDYFLEHGAAHNQAIIVRDKASKQDLPRALQGNLVFTALEAKGMEFEDVLVYNFFSDSAAREEWRVINTYLDESKQDTDQSTLPKKRDMERPLAFDPTAHQVLCSELKHLYMIVTRAKRSLWIFDDASERRQPIETLWNGKNFFTTKLEISQFESRKSTKSDWFETGVLLFKREKYIQAAQCFDKSGHPLAKTVAQAYVYLADCALEQNVEYRNKLYLQASKEFSKLIKYEDIGQENELRFELYVAECHYLANNLETAAHHFLHVVNNSDNAMVINKYLKICTGIFETTEKWSESAKLRERLGEFPEAALSYSKAKMHEDVVRTLANCSTPLQPHMERLAYDTARIFHKKRQKELMQTCLSRCSLSAHANFLDCLGEEIEAGQLIATYDKEEAINYFIKKALFSHAADIMAEDPQRKPEAAKYYIRDAKKKISTKDESNSVELSRTLVKACEMFGHDKSLALGQAYIISLFDTDPKHLKSAVDALYNVPENEMPDWSSIMRCMEKLYPDTGSDHLHSIKDFTLRHKYFTLLKEMALQFSTKPTKKVDMRFTQEYLRISTYGGVTFVSKNAARQFRDKFPSLQLYYLDETKFTVEEEMCKNNALQYLLARAYCVGNESLRLISERLEKNQVCQDYMSFKPCTHNHTKEALAETTEYRLALFSIAAQFGGDMAQLTLTYKNSPEGTLSLCRKALEKFFQEMYMGVNTAVKARLKYFNQTPNSVRNALQSLTEDCWLNDGPNPYSYYPTDFGPERANPGTYCARSDHVVKTLFVCNSVANNFQRFVDLVTRTSDMSAKYDPNTVHNGIVRNNQSRRIECVHEQLKKCFWLLNSDKPLAACHTLLTYFESCSANNCLPSPSYSLRLLNGFILHFVVHLNRLQSEKFRLQLPKSFVEFYLKNPQLKMLSQTAPSKDTSRMLVNLARALYNYVIFPLAPYNTNIPLPHNSGRFYNFHNKYYVWTDTKVLWQTILLLWTVIINTQGLHRSAYIAKLRSILSFDTLPRMLHLAIKSENAFENPTITKFMKTCGNPIVQISIENGIVKKIKPKRLSITDRGNYHCEVQPETKLPLPILQLVLHIQNLEPERNREPVAANIGVSSSPKAITSCAVSSPLSLQDHQDMKRRQQEQLAKRLQEFNNLPSEVGLSTTNDMSNAPTLSSLPNPIRTEFVIADDQNSSDNYSFDDIAADSANVLQQLELDECQRKIRALFARFFMKRYLSQLRTMATPTEPESPISDCKYKKCLFCPKQFDDVQSQTQHHQEAHQIKFLEHQLDEQYKKLQPRFSAVGNGSAEVLRISKEDTKEDLRFRAKELQTIIEKIEKTKETKEKKPEILQQLQKQGEIFLQHLESTI